MRIMSKLLLIVSLFQGLIFVSDLQAVPVKVKIDDSKGPLLLMEEIFAMSNSMSIATIVGQTFSLRPTDRLPVQGDKVLWSSYMPVTLNVRAGLCVLSSTAFHGTADYKVLRILRLTDKDKELAQQGNILVVNREEEHWESPEGKYISAHITPTAVPTLPTTTVPPTQPTKSPLTLAFEQLENLYKEVTPEIVSKRPNMKHVGDIFRKILDLPEIPHKGYHDRKTAILNEIYEMKQSHKK